MPSTPPAPQVDPAELARLVLRLREFRAELDGMLPSLPARDETPFLYRQLEEQIDALGTTLERIVDHPVAGKKPAKKKGLLARMLGGKPCKDSVRHPDLEGNSWTIPVPELVGFLAGARKTGVLWVDSKDEVYVLEFREGKLVRATSDQNPARLRLGELLVTAGVLDEEDVRSAVDEARNHELSLGAFLIESGRATSREVQDALAEQVQALFHRLMKTGNAIYRFQEGLDTTGVIELGLNVTSLLLESARKQDEEAHEPLLAALDAPMVALAPLPEDGEAKAQDADTETKDSEESEDDARAKDDSDEEKSEGSEEDEDEDRRDEAA